MLLATFLEKDNLKLLVYKGKTRYFAGQISFPQEVMRDAFVADAGKFSSQVKVAFAQKPQLKEVADVVLFLPPDKTFTKTLDHPDSVDSFVQTLPYFKEELIITNDGLTYTAFEKKLVEDLERPFLESGKKVLAVRGTINDLVLNYPAEAEYFLLASLEKDIAFAVARDGGFLEASEFRADIFVTRFGEYVLNHNLSEVKKAYTLGPFPQDLAEKIHHAQGLEVSSLAKTDVYDLIVVSYLKLSKKGLPNRRVLFAVGAAVVGFFLVLMIIRNLPKIGGKKSEVVSPVATPTAQVAPETKPADFKGRILNGTLVEGEAGRLADKLKEKGFVITETKNATSSGFVTTKLLVVKDVPDKITAAVKSILEENYETVFVEPLASDSAGVKIEIIIGKKK